MLPVWDSLQLWLYQLETFADEVVRAQLNHLSLASIAVIFVAGLITSLSPCMVSMLPIAIGYIGGYSQNDRRWHATVQSLWFAFGLAITLSSLGIAAAFLGRVYGQIGVGWTLLVSIVAIVMGLNLLEVLPLRFPTWFATTEISEDLPDNARAFLLGLTFGLVASPCSTPVLIALLGWVSTSGNPLVGGALLLAYAMGLVAPLVLVGTFTGSIKRLLSVRRWSGWLTYGSGVLLIGFGTLSILTRLA